MTERNRPGAEDGSQPAQTLRAIVLLAFLFVITGTAGWMFERIGAPLPWMIGPLCASAAIFIWGGLKISMPANIRPFGQVTVACQVGLAFSPAALALLLELAPLIVGTALMTISCVFAAAILLARFGTMSLTQAFLASAPTSPVEAASMAVRSGVDPMPVVFSQTLRLAAVVVLVPFGMYALEGWPESGRAAIAFAPFSILPVLLLAAIGLAGMIAFRMLRVPNPNFLGPLTLTAVLAATGNGPEPFPPIILALAQIVLGTWLGSAFRREIINGAGRLVLACSGTIILILVLCTAGAVAIATISGLDWRIMVLGAAPGGVVEMALTAQFLGQDVALISAFHLTRIFIFMPNVPWIVALISRVERRPRLRGE